jgi:DNA-binding beta-propeller fold protein YncE
MMLRPWCVLAVVLPLLACGSDEPNPGGADASVAGDPDAAPVLPSVFDVGSHPNGIAADDRYIYIVIGETHTDPNSVPIPAGTMGTVEVYSVADGTHVEDIDVRGGGHSLRLTPDGSELYVAHFSLDQVVTAIATDTLEVVAEIGGALQPHISVPDALSISSDGRYVYVGNNGASAAWVSRIDTETHAADPDWRVDVIGGYSCWVEVSASGDVLYANSWTGGTVQRKLVATEVDDGMASVGDFPHAVVLEPSGDYVYAFVSGGNRVVKLDAVTLAEVVEIPGPWGGFWGGPVSGQLSASGKSMFVANHALGGVAVVDIDPTSDAYDTAIDTIVVGADPIFMAPSVDGSTLFVANNESSTISVVDVSMYP